MEGDLIQGGEHTVQYTDGVLENFISETYMILLTNVTPINSIKIKKKKMNLMKTHHLPMSSHCKKLVSVDNLSAWNKRVIQSIPGAFVLSPMDVHFLPELLCNRRSQRMLGSDCYF